jgi:hypothetical protein
MGHTPPRSEQGWDAASSYAGESQAGGGQGEQQPSPGKLLAPLAEQLFVKEGIELAWHAFCVVHLCPH